MDDTIENIEELVSKAEEGFLKSETEKEEPSLETSIEEAAAEAQIPLTNPAFLDAIVAKILVIGESGEGKTGALASLICLRYHLFMIDTDNGSQPLLSLLKNERYPYKAYLDKHKINPDDYLHVAKISQAMVVGGDGIVRPKNANAWRDIASNMNNFTDTKTKKKYGNISTWEGDRVLVIDTFSTMSMMGFYLTQEMNKCLGDLEDPHGANTGTTQNMLRRMIEHWYSPAVPCNIILISHITNVDNSQGYIQSPEARARRQENPVVKAFPAAIGRALSPIIGKYFNDLFVVRSTGSGDAVKRVISTAPIDNVKCKTSNWLKTTYSTTTGLAEIFSALREIPLPSDFMEHFQGSTSAKPKLKIPGVR